jgi:hypothetical protein
MRDQCRFDFGHLREALNQRLSDPLMHLLLAAPKEALTCRILH